MMSEFVVECPQSPSPSSSPSSSSMYVQHQYMCSECRQLFNALEDVLVHQQSHFAAAGALYEGEGGELVALEGEGVPVEEEDGEEQIHIAGLAGLHDNHYQCLECGQLLVSPEELLQHQELHMRGVAEQQGPAGEFLEEEQSPGGAVLAAAPPSTHQIHYQCLECQALFDSPEVWLAHRQTHSKPQPQGSRDTAPLPQTSSLAGPTQHAEVLVQTDGSGGPFLNLQNLVLSEHRYEREGEILTLAQVLASRQLQSSTRGLAGNSGTATLQLQICSAQAIAAATAQHAGKNPASLTQPFFLTRTQPGGGGGEGNLLIACSGGAEHSYQRPPAAAAAPPAASEEEQQQQSMTEPEPMEMHPYECSECGLLFQTPEEFLEHQGAHFMEADKESGEAVIPQEVNGRGGGGGGDEEGEGEGEGGETEDQTSKAENGGAATGKMKNFVIVYEGGGQNNAPLLKLSPLLPSPSPRRCGECRLLFCTAEELGQHRRLHHVREEFRCPECGRLFTSANRLSAHSKVHQDGTHQCPQCSKVFKKPGSLQQHARLHSGEALHLCLDCGLGFATEMTLVVHRKTHAAEPLHRCQFCTKTFTNMTKYLYHRRTHTGKSGVPPSPGNATATIHANSPLLLTTATKMTSQPPLAVTSPATSQHQGEAELQEQGEQERGSAQQQQLQQQGEGNEIGGAPYAAGGSTAETNCNAGQQLGSENGNSAGVISNSKGLDTDQDERIWGNKSPATIEITYNSSTSSNTPAADHFNSNPSSLPDLTQAPGGAVEAGCFPCPLCPKSFPAQIRLVRHKRTVHTLERRFKCSVCGKGFKKQVHVRNHLRTHTGERPFQCSECGKTFSSLANLTRHGLTHTGQRPYKCEECGRAFTQSSNLQQHRLLHSSSPPFQCQDCDAAFTRPSKLAAHRSVHTGVLPYQCPDCPSSFLRRKMLELHRLSHEGREPSRCQSCGAAFVEPQKLAEHRCGGAAGAQGGLAKQRFECQTCGKRLNSPANLRLHELAHTGVRPFKCSQCPKGFTNKASLSLHERRHWGLSPHKCAECGKSFVSASGLSLHQRIHTGERPYPCPECGKRFRQATHLREHRRTHSGERPFGCEICPKRFVQSMHLAEHRRTHTGERPHRCPQPACGKAFKTFSNLRSHRKTHAKQQGEGPAPGQIQIQVQQQQQQQHQLQAPTIMCTEFGDTIAIIETSDSTLPIVETIEIYQAALESGLQLENITLENMQEDSLQLL
ncbi:zinc finger protein 574 isoform X2 [Polyodon spathula]|uniref:zinc finger protein 574 isoform X2 n=1 Tax=Polyodon spathula TaxID=7913 RepID=UPI001B7F4DC5|nr:zinc finger protein 574 isoform X2 [Polyodon spathula]